MKSLSKPILILLIAMLAVVQVAPSANLAISVNDSGATTAQYEKFHVISASYDFILTASNGIYTPGQSPNYIHVGGASHFVNFTHAALSAVTNPNQNFSLGAETNSMTMKLNAIASDHVEVVTTDTKAEKLSFGYKMPATLSANVPQTVLYTQGSTSQPIQQASYFTLASSFASCAAPCVFQNTANRTLIVSVPSTASGYTLDFYFPVYSAGGSSIVGGSTPSTGGGPTPSVTTTPAQNNSTAPSSTTGSIVQIAVVAVVVVVVVALVLGRASEGPFRRPRGSTSNPRKSKNGSPNWNRMVA